MTDQFQLRLCPCLLVKHVPQKVHIIFTFCNALSFQCNKNTFTISSRNAEIVRKFRLCLFLKMTLKLVWMRESCCVFVGGGGVLLLLLLLIVESSLQISFLCTNKISKIKESCCIFWQGKKGRKGIKIREKEDFSS